MTIQRTDLEFLLSHFEPPALPRRISTFETHGGQYPAFTIEYILAEFQRAREIDCKINAYRYLGEKYSTSSTVAGATAATNDNGNGKGNGNGNGHGKMYNPNKFCKYEYNEQLTHEDVAHQMQQKALSEAAPTFLNLDIDRKDFSNERTHKNAVKRTINRIHELFLIPKDKSPLTSLWTGGGNQILIPLEVDPAKYPVANKMTLNHTIPGRDLRYANLFTGSHDYRFSAYHKLPANLFLWFAEGYITQGEYDGGHKPSVRSAMIRVPGSYNSKYIGKDEVGSDDDLAKAEVKIEQRWDGVTRPHILFLLGAFYRDLGDSYRKQARKQAKAYRVKSQAMAAQMALYRTLNKMPVADHIAAQAFGEGAHSQYAHTKYWYIDKLLQTPLEDFRKRSVDLLLAPFLITVKGMSDAVAETMIMNWLQRCNALKPLDFDAEERIRSKIIDMRAALQTSPYGFLPLGEDKFRAEHSDWFDRVTGKKPATTRGGN
jgi:hypothetical protein